MSARGRDFLNQRLGTWLMAHMPRMLAEFILFIVKLAWAALFGIVLLIAIILSALFWPEDAGLARYDGLVILAVAVQVIFLWTRLETWEEARVIALFHLTGTVMEIFKLAQGSWDYPEQGLLEIGGVPLFSGFMYASVGSFIARVIRIFDMRFAPYPPIWMGYALAGAIYVNFFSHHFLPDIRIALFAATILLFWRTRIWFTPLGRAFWMPLPFAAGLSAFFLWVAENIGTATRTWSYPGQSAFEFVDISKFGSWYLLLYVSFATVTLVVRDCLRREGLGPGGRRFTGM